MNESMEEKYLKNDDQTAGKSDCCLEIYMKRDSTRGGVSKEAI